MLDIIKKAYNVIPFTKLTFLKNIPNQILYGRNYYKHKRMITDNKSLFQDNLYKTLCYNKKHTQYGKEKLNFKIQKEEVFDILNDLPVTNSSDLNDNLDYYKSNEFNRFNSYTATTGGTGRRATAILLSNESYCMEWAHINKMWEEVGYNKKNDTKLMLRGKNLPINILSQYNPIYNEIITDTFRINAQNFSKFAKETESFNIKFIHGYPSLLIEFKEYMLKNKIHYDLEALFLGSEGLSNSNYDELKKTFEVPFITWYGQTEKCILAYNNDSLKNGTFKVYSSYGYPQIQSQDTSGFGEIIGTSFINKALPLIKYSTGDFGRIFNDEKHLYIRDINGRWGKDFIYENKSKKISTTAINFHDKIQSEIKFYQIIQNEYAKIDILVVMKNPKAQNTPFVTESILQIFKNKLPSFVIKIKILESEKELQRGKRGKFKMLVQNLSLNGE